MKKKMIAAILVTACMGILAACGAQNAPASSVSEETPPAAEKAAGTATAQSPEAAPSSGEAYVTVTARGEVKVTPDIAQVTCAVTTQADTAEEAQKTNSEKVDAVLSMLKEKGVEEKNIETSGYSINPRYNWDSGKEEIIGYDTQTTLTISGQPLDTVGALLADLVNAGVNNIWNISFYSSTYDEAYNEALKEAVSAARAKAETIAAAAGKTLGDIRTMTEGYQDTSMRYVNSSIPMAEEAASEKTSYDVSIAPGELTVSAPVTMTYYLK